MFTSHGYLKIASNIYDIEAFCRNHEDGIRDIIEIDECIGVSFELDVLNNIVIAFSIATNTSDQREELYKKLIKQVSKNFITVVPLVRVNMCHVINENDLMYDDYFNDNTLDIFKKYLEE